MESEKPGIVSILAAATVDSEKPRVSISAVRAVAAARAESFLLTRTLSGSFSSAGSVPIRAPLTVDEDDDDDDDSVIEEHSLASSEASRGIDSGTDDGFESVSGDADDENELEDVITGGVRVQRLLGEELGGDVGDGSDDFSGGSVIYRPFADDIDEEASVNYSSFEEGSEVSDEVEGVSESEDSEADRVSMKAKVVIPRAILSLDDEEFDEILGSGDEEAVILRVTKAPSDEESEIGDRVLQFGDNGVVDEPECSGVVSTEEEVVRMNYSEELDDDLMSFGSIEEATLGVLPGGSNDFMAENEGSSTEASMVLGQSFKQFIEKGDVQSAINKDNGGGNIHDFDALMKQSDAERVEDNAVELAKRGMNDKPDYSGYNVGELVSPEEDMVQEKSFDDGLMSSESILGVVPRDCNEFLLESEGNAVHEDIIEADETISSLVEQGVGQASISNNITYVGSACEADELVIPGEGSIGSESRDAGDEAAVNMMGEVKEDFENDSGAVSELEQPESEDKPEVGMSSESFQLTPTPDFVTTRNLEVAGKIDFVESKCGSSDQNAKQESENEENQELDDDDRKLSLPGEDSASTLRSFFETANETVERKEQISEHINKQVNFQSDSEPNQISVGVEETILLSVKDIERTMPEISSVVAYDMMENETKMAQVIHNQTFMELENYEGTGDTREKLAESTFQNYSEVLPSDHSLQLISEKVKERVEKTQLLKEKLQRIIRSTGNCSENSAVTEAASKLSLAGGEHQTSFGIDYVSDGTKIVLPEQEVRDDLDFSINVLVIGKTGVGKSATINSIFGESKSPVGAFGVTTKSANYIFGNVGGILIRILDTPGLMSSATEEQFNQEVLMSIKKSMRKFPIDVFLYIDRLDDTPDIRLLRIITSSLGSSIWQNAIVVLTHAASDVPDTLSCKDFIAQRSSLMHQSIRQAVPKLSCVGQSKMPRIVLAENNMSSFSANKSSESTCPDWRLNLLILCCSVKIKSKAGSFEKQNTDVEKAGVFGSQPSSFTLFCSLWNVLLNSGHTSYSHDDLEEKKRKLLDCYPKIIWDEQSQECLEQETLLIENQEPEDEKAWVSGRVRTRRGRLGFQATKRLGIYLDTSDLHTGFSIGSRGCRNDAQDLVRMRGSMSVIGLVPMLMSVFTSVYGGKEDI
ncbi:PREDICTED: translocase of chloroplast 159, chloroplastic-like [Camelina sativa]|uniref:Translocase of chloroplast 159, chloroplastic-like n=1 Tax=Camelina sativa TaxID=90675 RepID=A0ABM0V689_CAMSA|nr:PREDICTED: translocase of chloroplast 159, chloroplastic-like [Camelina sativa]